jgi:2-oxoglutarate ferredoxin oxidoreductase subunit beta
VLYLEHGKPMIFGKNRDKGIRLRGLELEVVQLGGDIKEDDLLFHDEKGADPTLAYLLSRMHHPEFPEPMGVLRSVEHPTYEQLAWQQLEKAKQKPGRLEDLFNEGDTWVVQ